MSPAATFQQLAQDCQDLDIKDWDVYGDFHKTSANSFLRKFEAEIAEDFGKEDAVFMPSGVMAQSIALLIHSNNKKGDGDDDKSKHRRLSFACHSTSHLLLHEQEGYQELCGMSALVLPLKEEPGIGIPASPLLYRHLLEVDDLLLQGVSTLLLELPHRELGGKLTPWEDVLQMKEFLNQRGIAFHCDGARIFEATTGYNNKSPSELAEPFDSIYISFYKGLGGFSGAMLMGSKDFCDEARIWLRRFGGNLYTLLPYAVSGRSGYQKYWKKPQQQQKTATLGLDPSRMMSFEEKKEKLVRIAKSLSSDENFSQVVTLEPPVPQVNMVHFYLRPDLEECNLIRDGIQERFGVSVFHRIRSIDEDDDPSAFAEGFRCKLEMYMGEANGSVPDDIWIQAWTEFCKASLPGLLSTERR
jgi:threonine aldolase